MARKFEDLYQRLVEVSWTYCHDSVWSSPLPSVFLRPTFYEGDSVSLREALALGLPVIASDTGFRPNEVRRFKMGNCKDLCLQLDVVLSQAARGAPVKHDGHLQEGSAPRMLELYRKFW